MNHKTTPSSVLRFLQSVVAVCLITASIIACEEAENNLVPPTDILPNAGETPSSAASQALNEAIKAQGNDDIVAAAAWYKKALDLSSDPWTTHAALSGMLAMARMSGDLEEAFKITQKIRTDRPEFSGLMEVWDGDTLMLTDNPSAALPFYQRALDLHGNAIMNGRPLGQIALEQIARAYFSLEDSASAAASLRYMTNRFALSAGETEFALARAKAYEAMANDRLPVMPLAELIHDGICSAKAPCVISDGQLQPQLLDESVELAGIEGIQFVLNQEDLDAFKFQELARQRQMMAITTTATSCATPTATSGFQKPMTNDHSGYTFMQSPDSTGGYHPGLDVNGPGSGDADCTLYFASPATSCVTDSSPSNWGSATTQAKYGARTWTMQFGHASSILYSYGALVMKGASLGRVGKVGATSCHVHDEVRESDHPAPTNADYYNTSSQTSVGDWYEDPYRFFESHPAYSWLKEIDENDFVTYGSWTLVSGIGNYDDLKYAPTTPASSKVNYARHSFSAPSSRTFKIYTFVPWNHATSTAALIKVLSSNGTVLLTKTINQLAYYDAWLMVGSVSLTAGSTYILEVSSNTGESSKKVALDGFLILY